MAAKKITLQVIGDAVQHDGVTYRFCSVRCMERFRAEPEHYLQMDPSDRRM